MPEVAASRVKFGETDIARRELALAPRTYANRMEYVEVKQVIPGPHCYAEQVRVPGRTWTPRPQMFALTFSNRLAKSHDSQVEKTHEVWIYQTGYQEHRERLVPFLRWSEYPPEWTHLYS